ncbi:hypothetical protein GCM10010383_67610 [Streptomyces lomondensis]|uniref:Uncharacterized protein n=1 Tax=Streptomyces lomondensis TaxID=68229 RepID=A0ABQ2XP88_9ACTN|nr:hypothetical protein GCM10010383_67610 [Streptomyces lomondensis]
MAAVSCQRTSSRTGGRAPVRALARSDAEMMAFMFPILAHRTGRAVLLGPSARPVADDHLAYGNKHMLYS